MKQSVQHLTALILAMTMCLSLLSVNVWAIDTEPTESTGVSNQVYEEVSSLDESSLEETEAEPTGSEAENSDSSQEEENATISTQSSGTHGDSITWTYDEETHSFTISGSGKVEKIGGEYPWSDISGIKRITFESGITSIGANAFDSGDGYDLEEVNIGDTVESIGDYAFSECRNLKRITIPSSVKKIGANAFEYCERMTTLSLTDGLKTIGNNAFSGCRGLTSVSIPDTVTSIGNEAFSYCSYLYQVKLPSGLTELSDGMFLNDNQLTLITLPDSVVKIGESSFYECSHLSQINFPKSLTEINETAFYLTNISKVIIPSAVSYVADRAFSYCPVSLLIFEGSPFSTWENCISDDYETDCIIYYPDVYKDRWTILSSYDDEWLPYCHLENDEIITAHTFGEGVVTKEPTYTQAGIKTFTCTHCGCVKSEILPKLVKEPVPLDECEITLSELKYVYDGRDKKPAISVTHDGESVDSTNYSASYSNNVNAGTATVRITGKNDFTGTITKSFIIAKAEQTMQVDITDETIYAGSTSNLIVEGIGSFQYEVDNENVAVVNSKGVITGLSAGTTTITVLASGNSNYEPGMMNVDITVLPQRKPNSITASNFVKSFSAKAQSFNLNAKTDGGAKLSYKSNNKKVTVKSGNVTIAAKFSGTAKITITAAATNEYNGVSKTITVSVPTVTNVAKAIAGKSQMTVQWKKNTTGKGYDIQYSTDKKFKKGAKTVKIKKNSTVKTTTKKLKKGTYYVRIRTINGKCYADWSKTKTVKVK